MAGAAPAVSKLAQVAGVADAAGSALGKLDKKAGKPAARALRTPRAQVRKSIKGAGELFWRVLIALVALSLFALVLKSATTAPKRLDQLTQTLPNALDKFINPFKEAR